MAFTESELKRRRKQDKEANLFAMALLMPEKFMRQDISSVRTEGTGMEELVDTLARKYKVSNEVMTLRLVQLGYFNL